MYDQKAYIKQYYLDHKDKMNAQSRAYWANNKEKQKVYRLTYIPKYRKETKQRIHDHYGNKCSCPNCPETNPLFLTIDHINNDGNILRVGGRRMAGQLLYRWIIKNNFPDTIRLLCWNCNSGRHFNGGICPHGC